MQAALKAFETWSRTTVEERTQLLFRVGAASAGSASLNSRRGWYLKWARIISLRLTPTSPSSSNSAISMPWKRSASDQAKPVVQLPGEHDQFRHIPLGVGAVISPWNFPAAIMGGMTLASVVSGNTVVLKPSGDSPTIAAKFMEILEAAGLPDGVVNYCPGHGVDFGSAVGRASEDAVHRIHRV